MVALLSLFQSRVALLTAMGILREKVFCYEAAL